MIREWERSLLFAVLAVGVLALVSVWLVDGRFQTESSDTAPSTHAQLADDWGTIGDTVHVDLADDPMRARVPLRPYQPPTHTPPVAGVKPPANYPISTPLPTPPLTPVKPIVSHSLVYLGYMRAPGAMTLPYLKVVREVDGKVTQAHSFFVQTGQTVLGYRIMACDHDGVEVRDGQNRISTLRRNIALSLGD